MNLYAPKRLLITAWLRTKSRLGPAAMLSISPKHRLRNELMKRWINSLVAAGLIVSTVAVAQTASTTGTLETPATVIELDAECATRGGTAIVERKPASAQCLRYASDQLVRVTPGAYRFDGVRSEDVDSAFERGWSELMEGGNGSTASTENEATESAAAVGGLLIVCEGSRPDRRLCGIQDASGSTVVPLKFDEVRPNAQSDAQAVRFDKRWGYYSMSKNRLIVVPQFIQVGDFSEGSAFVETSDTPPRTWIIDENGNRKSELPTGTHISGSTAEGLSSMKLDGRFGYIDERGNVAIEPQFNRATPFNGGHAFVQFSEQPAQYAVIDRQGRGLVFFEVPVTSFLPVGRGEFIALSDCSRQRGCVARCVSVAMEGNSRGIQSGKQNSDPAARPDTVSIQSACLDPRRVSDN